MKTKEDKLTATLVSNVSPNSIACKAISEPSILKSKQLLKIKRNVFKASSTE